MNVLDNINSCLRQIKNQLETLADFGGGGRIFENGAEITAERAAKAREIIAEKIRLIGAYRRLP